MEFRILKSNISQMERHKLSLALKLSAGRSQLVDQATLEYLEDLAAVENRMCQLERLKHLFNIN